MGSAQEAAARLARLCRRVCARSGLLLWCSGLGGAAVSVVGVQPSPLFVGLGYGYAARVGNDLPGLLSGAAQPYQQRRGDQRRPTDAGPAVHRHMLAVVEARGEDVEQRPDLLGIGDAEIDDRERVKLHTRAAGGGGFVRQRELITFD